MARLPARPAVTAVVTLFTIAGSLAAGAVALAAHPKAGTYTGTLAAPRTGYLVTLTVRGNTVKSATLSDVPLYCQGGGPAIPVRFGAAKISSQGTFTDHAIHRTAVGPLKGRIGQRLTLAGRFTGHGTASGTLHTVFPGIRGCSGTSRFSAKR